MASSRAKDGAISPRLANRYSRFALSHRSCGDGARRVLEWEQRVERSQPAPTYRFPALSATVDYEVYAQHDKGKSDTKSVSQFDDRSQVYIDLKITQ